MRIQTAFFANGFHVAAYQREARRRAGSEAGPATIAVGCRQASKKQLRAPRNPFSRTGCACSAPAILGHVSWSAAPRPCASPATIFGGSGTAASWSASSCSRSWPCSKPKSTRTFFSIRSTTSTRSPAASRIRPRKRCCASSEIMRYLLYESSTDTVPLSRELAHLRSFLDLQRLRLAASAQAGHRAGSRRHQPRLRPPHCPTVIAAAGGKRLQAWRPHGPAGGSAYLPDTGCRWAAALFGAQLRGSRRCRAGNCPGSPAAWAS